MKLAVVVGVVALIALCPSTHAGPACPSALSSLFNCLPCPDNMMLSVSACADTAPAVAGTMISTTRSFNPPTYTPGIITTVGIKMISSNDDYEPCFCITTAISLTLQYLFTKADYSLDETGTADAVTVELQRTSLISSELTVQTTVTLGTTCPTDCETLPGTASATLNTDYTLATNTITFAANDNKKAVSITIIDDSIQENREYFCLSVEDPELRGSQWSTRIVIPWNDNCVDHYSPDDGGSTAAPSAGFDITDPLTAVNGYVGPWSHTDMPTLTIDVEGYDTADSYINLFLTTTPDTLGTIGTFDYYGILLDNTFNVAPFDTGNTPGGHSVIVKDALNNNLGAEETGDQITASVDNTLELTYSYTSSTADISIQRTSPTTSTELAETDATNPFNVGHLFVSSAAGVYAQWSICGLPAPRRLEAVGAYSSGEVPTFGADRAIDGNRDPGSMQCFVSADDSSSRNWLQIDLGRVLHVMKVIIFPVTPMTGLSEANDLNDARVYVGSCKPGDISDGSNMHQCSGAIGTVNGAQIIEVDCPTGSTDYIYGRYVYILPDTNTNTFSVCEVEVYGDEVPIDKEPMVEFTANEINIAENAGPVQPTLTRSGDGNTCTYVDYYTDVATGNDFTGVPLNNPQTVQWIGSSATTTQQLSIAITDDDWCESDEKFNVSLSNAVGGNIGTFCYTTVTIQDEDSVTYSLVSTPSSISEGAGPLSIRVDRTGDGLMQDGMASLTFTDITATSADYTNTENTLPTYASTSSSSQTEYATIQLVNDDCYEEDETFTVTLNAISPQCSSVSSSPATITLTDDDSKYKWDVTSPYTIVISEGTGTTPINIRRTGTGQVRTVDFDDTHVSTSNGDFSITPSTEEVTFNSLDTIKTVNIIVADDYEVEETETFTLTLEDPLGANCCDKNLDTPSTINIQITDNDAKYYWKDLSKTIAENSGFVEVCLLREGDTTTSQSVGILASGITAQSGTDFTSLSTINFATSDGSEKCVNVQINQDNVAESSETFSLTINPNQNLEIDSAKSVLTVTITDEDSVVSWVSTAISVNEGDTTAELVISHTGSNQVTVRYNTNSGSAIGSSGSSTGDFRSASGTVTLPANVASSQQSVFITINNDDVYEQTESFTVLLTSVTSGTLSSLPTATVTITDDDPAPTEAPPDDGLSGGAIAGIVVAAVVGLLVILGAIAFLLCMTTGGLGAGAATAGVAGTAGAGSALGAQQLATYPSTNAYGLQNFSYGNGYGVSNFGNKPYGFP